MDLEQLLSGAGGMGLGGMGARDPHLNDTAETIHISSVALLKMLKHGRAGVPLEVMGLMLGEFVDDYTVRVVDVFAMPQSGTGVSVEAVDPVFQTKMLDMLKQVGRPETVVGWYHSHPGFGPWLSAVDVNTQASFEALNKRAVAVVIDPIQSVRGKVVIDAFRIIPNAAIITQTEPRQTTSNIGHLHKPSIVALIHGLNRNYYSMPIEYRRGTEAERRLLRATRPESAASGPRAILAPEPGAVPSCLATNTEIASLAAAWVKSMKEERGLSPEEMKTRHVGRQDPKRHLGERADAVAAEHTAALMTSMANRVVF